MMLMPERPAFTDTDLYRTATHYEDIATILQPKVTAVLPDVEPAAAQTYLQMCVDGFQHVRTQLEPSRLGLLWASRHEPTIKQTEYLAARMLALQLRANVEPLRFRTAVRAGRYLMATTVGVISPDGQKIAQMAKSYTDLRAS